MIRRQGLGAGRGVGRCGGWVEGDGEGGNREGETGRGR